MERSARRLADNILPDSDSVNGLLAGFSDDEGSVGSIGSKLSEGSSSLWAEGMGGKVVTTKDLDFLVAGRRGRSGSVGGSGGRRRDDGKGNGKGSDVSNGASRRRNTVDDIGNELLGARDNPEGQFIPKTLSEAFREIEEQYDLIKNDPDFLAELAVYRKDFVGGPTPLHLADRLTEMCGGAKIWLKREDLAHTGAHKINNAIGQALLAKKIGKPRIIAETGAGQHGVTTATICAKLGLDCTVYMGAVDCERQKLNVFRMNTLGAKVVPVHDGLATLKDAINEAMRDWVTNVRNTHYLVC